MKNEALRLAIKAMKSFQEGTNGLYAGEFDEEIAKCEKALAQPVQEPPSEWAGIKAILDEYGLQAIDFVADFKAALAQPEKEPVQEKKFYPAQYPAMHGTIYDSP